MSSVLFNEIAYGLTVLWDAKKNEAVYYWYKKAWTILERYGLTKYETTYEKCEVYIRALSLSMIYAEFNKLAFNEFDYYSCYNEKYEDVLTEMCVGQLYASRFKPSVEIDANEALCALADAYRDEVFTTLKKDIDEYMMFAGMFLSASSEYPPFDYNDYDSFWGSVERHSEIIISITESSDYEEAFIWLVDGTYCLGLSPFDLYENRPAYICKFAKINEDDKYDEFQFKLYLKYRQLIKKHAERITEKLIKKAISSFQREKLQDENGTGLKNEWDRLCAELQGEHTAYEYYHYPIEACVTEKLIPSLSEIDKEMLWLQTDGYERWEEMMADDYICDRITETCIDFTTGLDIDDIADYLEKRIIDAALNYTNSRIEAVIFS